MTVKKLAALLASAIISLSAASCDKSPSGPDEPTFTQRIAFYGASSAIPVPVVVTVDGTQVGTITGYWPAGPGNCSADFTAKTEVHDVRTHDWNARTPNGLAFSGTFAATAGVSNGCKIIQVF